MSFTATQQSRVLEIRQPQSRVLNIDTSSSTDISGAIDLSYDASGASITQSNIQSAITELANRFHGTLSSAPTTGVNEGDLWYDLTNHRLKLRSEGGTWDRLGGDASVLDGPYFRYTSDGTISSGNLAEFRNNSSTPSFSIRHDGVVILKNQSSSPSVVADGLYSDGTDLYYGKQ